MTSPPSSTWLKGSWVWTVKPWRAETARQWGPVIHTGDPQSPQRSSALPTWGLDMASSGTPALWGLRTLPMSEVRDPSQPPAQAAISVTTNKDASLAHVFPEPWHVVFLSFPLRV